MVRKGECCRVGFVIAGLVMKCHAAAAGLCRHPWRCAEGFLFTWKSVKTP